MAILNQPEVLADFERDGFARIRNPFTQTQIDSLSEAIESFRESQNSVMAAGFRNLLKQCEGVRRIAESKEIREIVEPLQGKKTKPVRSIFFDKTPASNWYVTWHQDLSIAVERRIETEGYGPWSLKDGTVHTQPPKKILESIVSLRIHLDECPEENGAIKFIAGSHRDGIFKPAEIAECLKGKTSIACPAERGDIILMRPLILHSSSKSIKPGHRRVLHLEFSAAILPNGLSWTES